MKIPTYGPDGQRRRSFSLEAVLHFESLSLVFVRRNRRGVVTRAHFRPPDGGNPLASSCRLGQRYSFEARSNGVHFWEFSEFMPVDFFRREGMDEDQANAFLRDLFLSVPLSCVREAPTPTVQRKLAEVVCIDAHRPRREYPLAA